MTRMKSGELTVFKGEVFEVVGITTSAKYKPTISVMLRSKRDKRVITVPGDDEMCMRVMPKGTGK